MMKLQELHSVLNYKTYTFAAVTIKDDKLNAIKVAHYLALLTIKL